jgi:hypothetical protein
MGTLHKGDNDDNDDDDNNNNNNTTSTVHNFYNPKQITRNLKPLNLRPVVCVVTQKAVILNAFRALGMTVNNKCLVSETFTVMRTSYTAAK